MEVDKPNLYKRAMTNDEWREMIYAKKKMMIDFIQALILRECVRDPNASSSSTTPPWPKVPTTNDFRKIHLYILYGEDLEEVIDRDNTW